MDRRLVQKGWGVRSSAWLGNIKTLGSKNIRSVHNFNESYMLHIHLISSSLRTEEPSPPPPNLGAVYGPDGKT